VAVLDGATVQKKPNGMLIASAQQLIQRVRDGRRQGTLPPPITLSHAGLQDLVSHLSGTLHADKTSRRYLVTGAPHHHLKHWFGLFTLLVITTVAAPEISHADSRVCRQLVAQAQSGRDASQLKRELNKPFEPPTAGDVSAAFSFVDVARAAETF
jgi:hypothetical protein